MDDTGQATALTGTTEAPPAEIPQYVGEDGNFVEDWTHLLKDESLHDNPTLSTIHNLDTLASIHVQQRRKIGGNVILAPSESSTEADWEEYYKAGGRPDTAGDYTLTRPTEVPEGMTFNENLEKTYRELAHSLGFNQKQVDAIYKLHNDNITNQLKEAKLLHDQQVEEAKTALKEKWGEEGSESYNRELNKANTVVRLFSEEGEEREWLLELVGNNPRFSMWASKVGGKLMEDTDVRPDTGMAPPGFDETISELMAQPVYGPDYRKHGFTRQAHQAAVRKVANLYTQKDKETKRKA